MRYDKTVVEVVLFLNNFRDVIPKRRAHVAAVDIVNEMDRQIGHFFQPRLHLEEYVDGFFGFFHDE